MYHVPAKKGRETKKGNLSPYLFSSSYLGRRLSVPVSRLFPRPRLRQAGSSSAQIFFSESLTLSRRCTLFSMLADTNKSRRPKVLPGNVSTQYRPLRTLPALNQAERRERYDASPFSPAGLYARPQRRQGWQTPELVLGRNHDARASGSPAVANGMGRRTTRAGKRRKVSDSTDR